MIKIVSKMAVKPGNVEEFKKRIAPLVAASRAEAGNIQYTLNQHLSEPETLTFLEIWKDQDAINEHVHSEHFTTIFPTLMELCGDPIPVELYEEIEF